jgi:hypothetical protein
MVAEKLNWRPAEEWRNYEFTELSDKILDDTGVNLSATTLKRVFGKLKYNSLPSSSTLNALAAYLGFSSWMDFTSQVTLRKQPEQEPISIAKKKVLISKTAWITVAAIACVSIVLAFTFLPGKSATAILHPEEIIFTSKPLAEGLPNSVVFNIDLKGNRPQHSLIQQYWDSTKTVLLQPGQKEATGIYYVPGYFRAKLILDGKIIKEHDLFIRSDQWMATIEEDTGIPVYVKKEDLLLNNSMEVDDDVLTTIQQKKSPVWLTYHLVRPFQGLQSDNFSLETSIKNTYAEGPAVCKTGKIFVLCKKKAFIIPFTIPGCVSDINFKASELYYPGKSNNLVAFGADLSNWSEVKVKVKNRRLSIYLNGQLIREETYQQDAGEVVGLRFSFLGAGAVKYVTLSDAQDQPLYVESFISKELDAEMAKKRNDR